TLSSAGTRWLVALGANRLLRLEDDCPPFVFFFSSRRRHTILVSDWSSDVCSSDLPESDIGWTWQFPDRQLWPWRSPRQRACRDRSEERRVGKEGRSRWGPGYS